MALCVAILAGLATLAILFKPFFGECEDFRDWLNEVYLPNLTWLSDKGDLLTEAKIVAWELCGFLVGIAAYVGFRTLFG